MDLYINTLSNNQLLSSFNFARNSDLVYSEVVSKEEFKKIDNNNLLVISEDDNYIFYKAKSYSISENMIVFTNLFCIDALFEELYKLKNFRNIKIVTHQSDLPITKNIFLKKPNCVSEWYSINAKYKTKDLIPIPIGLSNVHYSKNLTKEHFSKIKPLAFSNKIEKLYVNFEVNTNFNERYKLIKFFKNKSWAIVETNKLSLDNYLHNLNKYKYILCPPGNGLDTHRMWETLYAESIPVINNNYTYSAASNLATFKIDNFFKLSIKNLNEYQYKTISKNQLNIDYWFKKIRKNLIPNNQDELCINESDKKQKDVISKYHEDLDKIKRIKKLKTFERKIKKRIF